MTKKVCSYGNKVYRSLVVAVLTLTTVCAHSQNERTLKTEAFTYYFHTVELDKHPRLQNELSYHWFANNRISRTQGDFSGQLLSSEYKVVDRDDRLVSKGNFKTGLKHGVWYQWDESGNLLSREEYKHGLLHGISTYFIEGKLTKTSTFKKGELHGVLIDQSSGTPIAYTYKKGVLVPAKEEPIKKSKIRAMELDEERSEKPREEKVKRVKEKKEPKVKKSKKDKKAEKSRRKEVKSDKPKKKRGKKKNDDEEG